jgi:methanethiol S-methyltransferase
VARRAWLWIGGGLFCVALAWCAWWYLFAAGRTGRPGGAPALAIDAALFSVFALHHSLFAREFAKRWLAGLDAQLIRSVYVYAASALLIGVCVLWRPIGGELYRATGALAIALGAVQVVGVAVIARSAARIDPLELAGIHETRTGDPLVTSGPYTWVRHPLYFGWVLAVFATPHMTGDRLAFAALSTAYLAAAVPFEERSLVRAFGDDYVRYQRAVRWRIVPFIY